MKKRLIFFLAILFSEILAAQKPYDPLTDPIVQQPANPTLFLEQMRATRRDYILQATEIGKTEIQALMADFDKTKKWTSIIQAVALRNTSGNEEEANENYELAKQLYYQVVWNKVDYSKYYAEDPIVGFYYFKTCYDLGRLLSKMEDYKSSYEFYTTAVDYYKTDSSLYFAAVAGMKGIENKNLSSADYGSSILKIINKAIELKPGSSLYLRTRGELYLNHLKDTARAITDFTKATQLNPKDDNAYFYLAVINFLQHKYPDAIKNITSCIKLNPKKEGYPYYRAVIYKELENYTAAITDYTAAIILYGIDANYYKDRGYCYYKLNNVAAAYDDYGFAIMLNPKDEGSKGNLKILDPLLKAAYEKMGFTPQNAYPFFLKIADTLSDKKNYGPAVMNYQKCIQVQPQNPAPYNKAGVIFNSLGMNEVAKQYLRYAAYADGKNPEYFINLGDTYYDLRDFKTASGCYDTAALLGSKDAFTYNINGQIKQYQLKNYEGAIKDYTKAYELNPEYNEVYLKNRGGLYKELKNYKAALADFELLNKLDPQNEVYKNEIQGCKEKLKG